MIDIEQYVQKYWQQKINDIRDSLKRAGKYASGTTASEMEMTFSSGNNKYTVRLIMPEYYSFIDQGVKGTKGGNRTSGRFAYKDKQPPLKTIRSFMRNRGIVGANFKQSKNIRNKALRKRSIEKELDSVAFAIAKSIKENGLEQTNFYSDNINDKTINEFEGILLRGYKGKILEIFAN